MAVIGRRRSPHGALLSIPNVDVWGPQLLEQLRRTMTLTARPQLRDLYDEVRAYPNVAGFSQTPEAGTVLIPFDVVNDDGTQLSLFTTVTTFGTPHDVTVGELTIELFFPADDASEALLRSQS